MILKSLYRYCYYTKKWKLNENFSAQIFHHHKPCYPKLLLSHFIRRKGKMDYLAFPRHLTRFRLSIKSQLDCRANWQQWCVLKRRQQVRRLILTAKLLSWGNVQECRWISVRENTAVGRLVLEKIERWVD